MTRAGFGYALILFIGITLGIYAEVSAWSEYKQSVAEFGSEAWHFRGWHIQSVGGDGFVLLLISLIYSYAFLRKGLKAPVIYALSAGFAVFSTDVVLISFGKADDQQDISYVSIYGGLLLIIVASIVVFGFIWAHRKSRR